MVHSTATVADPPLVRPHTDSADATYRRRAALRLALRRYSAELRHRPVLAAVALVGPALGNISLNYLPPLVVAGWVTGAGGSVNPIGGATLVAIVVSASGTVEVG